MNHKVNKTHTQKILTNHGNEKRQTDKQQTIKTFKINQEEEKQTAPKQGWIDHICPRKVNVARSTICIAHAANICQQNVCLFDV